MKMNKIEMILMAESMEGRKGSGPRGRNDLLYNMLRKKTKISKGG